jgi:hypothetical protein
LAAVVRVDFYQGNTLIGTSSVAPYTATWSNVAAGTYCITARATDNGGKTGTSAAARHGHLARHQLAGQRRRRLDLLRP